MTESHYVDSPTRVETVIIAESTEDMLDMYRVAQMVDGVTLETLPCSNVEEFETAVDSYRKLAIFFNKRDRHMRVQPEGWAEKARRSLTAGGHVLRMTIESSAVSSAHTNEKIFYGGLAAIRKQSE